MMGPIPVNAFDPPMLLVPSAYPHHPRSVRLVETHISWVFLAGEYVYKVKKPVNFGFLDYSSLAKRKRLCEEEVRLNRRLCPDAYLGVEKIIALPNGLRVGGAGRAIEYAVVMRRLPADRMLDRLIDRGLAGEETIARVADRIATFHGSAATGPEIDSFGSITAVRQNWQENFDQIEPFVGQTISRGQLALIQRAVNAFLDDNEALFIERQQTDRIRDCHGDMRAESICVTNGLCIFDCIEFSSRYRCGDTASEIAFLAMDIDARGRPDLAYWLMEHYIEVSGDAVPRVLLRFFASYRAFVRGKVQSLRLSQPVKHESVHRTARRRARHYLRLAWQYARVPKQALLIVVVGLPGTGKTTVSRSIGMRLGAAVYSSDRARKQIAGLQDTHRSGDGIDAGLYSEEMSRRTYAELGRLAARALKDGESVVLDATFRTRSDRAEVFEIARSLGCECWAVECRLPESMALGRIASRAASGEGASDATADVYRVQRDRYELVAASETRRIQVDTSKSIGAITNNVMSQLLARSR